LTDDEYSKFEPWMDLDFNIIPQFEGIYSTRTVYTLNQYEIERKTVRIEEAYEGFVATGKTWEGYSVNDLIATTNTNPEYHADRGRLNSLIRYLNNSIPDVQVCGGSGGSRTFTGNYFPWYRIEWYDCPAGDGKEGSDQDNQLLWIDYAGYELKIGNGNLNDYLNFYRPNSGLFTLVEVINFYDENGDWEYCDLIYEREVYTGIGEPPSGTVSTSQDISYGRVRGWYYDEDAEKWYRRPIDIMGTVYPYTNPESMTDFSNVPAQTQISGDGRWYSPLIDGIIEDKIVKRQYLYRNVREYSIFPTSWYENLYGVVVIDGVYHKPLDIVKKFIKYIKTEGSDTTLDENDVVSNYFSSITNPFTKQTNQWNNLLLIQNSDLKRPLATEKATKEIFTFNNFLDMLCSISNCAWAIIDGKLRIEHVSWFERGLSYDLNLDDASILNPYSIFNFAKNKGFMEYTDIYSYDKANMPKFEIFKTVGGEEPKNNNSKVVYSGACINNKPKENTSEILIATTTDTYYTRTEGDDKGVTLILTKLVYVPSADATLNTFLPEKDENQRYVYNLNFSLEDIIKKYHTWGRILEQAELNKQEWTSLQPFKNVIQLVSFPYKVVSPTKMENPYTLIITGLGYGIINQMNYETKIGWVNYELGLNPIENVVPPDIVMDWHLHEQETESDRWTVSHEMDNIYMFRPMVFNDADEAIEYNSFRVINNNTVRFTFSEPVTGYVHLIAMNVGSSNLFVEELIDGNELEIIHNADRPNQLALSVFMDSSGFEMLPDEIYYGDDGVNKFVRFTFTENVTGQVAVANIHSYIEQFYQQDITSDTAQMTRNLDKIYARPVVLMADSEINYDSDKLTNVVTPLREIGFSESVIARIIVMEKTKT